ncbi:MAG: DUF4012 domain-containing protein [Candidatus Limnocylindrales bacterium]
MIDDPETPHRRRRRHRRARVGRRFAIGGAIAALVVLGLGALAAFRYLPALDEARAVRVDLEAMAAQVQAAGLAIDGPTIDALSARLATDRRDLSDLEDLLGHDPLIAIARGFPLTEANVRGADAVVAAAHDLFDAADAGLVIGRRYVAIKEAHATNPANSSVLAQLVELMATSRDSAVAAAADMSHASATLATVPNGLASQIEGARDSMTTKIAKYRPILDGYVTASAELPAILGWNGPRRYLVLTQDPAELRPTGGYTGSYGILEFNKGQITERSFRDIFLLDLPWTYPFVKPPPELADYLLGPKQPWQLADANWSPDFPTSAQQAIRLYANESGDTNIDGVFGITTYTIDQLLTVTGPITVPSYNTTIASGETTLKVLQLTRVARSPTENRKAFLSTFADALVADLVALPPSKWGDILGQADTFRTQREFLAWFADPAAEALTTAGGFDGAVRQDPGDYIYPVDSNVAPVSKLNAVTTRSLDLNVAIDQYGNALDTLAVTWQNGILDPQAAPYRALPEVGSLHMLGMYFRALVPDRSRVDSVSGGSFVRLTAPAVVETEAGRTAIGTYLMVPPGQATLRYSWTSPYAADADQHGGLYRLTIQRQPGILPGPLTLTIRVPDGFHITAASAGLTVSAQTATLTTTFDQDIVLGIRYAANTP